MSAGDVIARITEGLVALGIPGGVVWWVRDRRKSKAETAVAERTVEPQVEKADIGAAEARMAFLQQAMDRERAFRVEQIADRDAEIARQRAEIEFKDQVIEELRTELAELQRRLTATQRRLDQLDLHTHREGTTP